MNLEDLGNLGELVAAVATVATLIYLAMQIRQNNVSVRINAGQSILASLNQGLQIAASTSQAAHALVLGQTDFEKLTEDEKAQFLVWIFAWFRILEQGYYYHRKGYLDDEVWLGHVEHLKQVMQCAPIRHWWALRSGFFNSAFQSMVNEALTTGTSMPAPRGVMQHIEAESQAR